MTLDHSSHPNLLELSGVHTHIGAYHILHGVCLLYTSDAADD